MDYFSFHTAHKTQTAKKTPMMRNSEFIWVPGSGLKPGFFTFFGWLGFLSLKNPGTQVSYFAIFSLRNINRCSAAEPQPVIEKKIHRKEINNFYAYTYIYMLREQK